MSLPSMKKLSFPHDSSLIPLYVDLFENKKTKWSCISCKAFQAASYNIVCFLI